MPVKPKTIISSDSETEENKLSACQNGEGTTTSSLSSKPKVANPNSSISNVSEGNRSSQNMNGNAQESCNGKDYLDRRGKDKKGDDQDSKYASYLYSGGKDGYDSEASGMLYRTDSNDELAEDEVEEEGCLWYIQNCFHPKIQKHWKTFLAAIMLSVAGLAFLIAATIIAVTPEEEDGSEPHSYVFYLCGIICLIPGVYYVIYIYRAAKGEKGYKLENIPTFSN